MSVPSTSKSTACGLAMAPTLVRVVERLVERLPRVPVVRLTVEVMRLRALVAGLELDRVALAPARTALHLGQDLGGDASAPCALGHDQVRHPRLLGGVVQPLAEVN